MAFFNILLLFVVASVGYVECIDQPPRTWVVDLDAPADKRWPFEQMLPYYNQSVHDAIALIGQFIPYWLDPVVEDMALLVLNYLGDYAHEIRHGASVFNIPLGAATLLNIIYEVEAGCTSIVGQSADGHIYHGRNLDFNLASVLRHLTIRVQFVRNGKTAFWGTTYVGYIGLLTGMKPGAFSITVDQRDSGYQIENLLEALFVPGTSVSAFLVRETLDTKPDFDTAVKVLSTVSIPAPVYLIVAGTKPGEGAVITRDRMYAEDIWRLNNTGGLWNLVETNYDHWKPAGDDRRKTAMDGMAKVGQRNLNLDNLFSVLSLDPVMNDGTTYTTLMDTAVGNMTVWIRQL